VLQEKKKKEAHLNHLAHLPSDHLPPIAFFFVRTSIRARHAPYLVDGTARRCSSLPIKSPPCRTLAHLLPPAAAAPLCFPLLILLQENSPGWSALSTSCHHLSASLQDKQGSETEPPRSSSSSLKNSDQGHPTTSPRRARLPGAILLIGDFVVSSFFQLVPSQGLVSAPPTAASPSASMPASNLPSRGRSGADANKPSMPSSSR
jgi:hypothetical protein